ncbi:hypothetical protein OAE19_08045 [Porticoccaceae bacterium]|nr:hypothetical protein [Porticoccaceae bacterium]
MIDPLFVTVATVFIGLFFVMSGLHKVTNRVGFLETLSDYQLLPYGLLGVVAIALPLAEITIGVVLLLPSTVLPLMLLHSVANAAALLLALYSVAMAINIYRGRVHIDCGCSFQQRKITLSNWHLLRNALLIGLVLVIRLPMTDRVLFWPDFINMLAALTGLGLIYLSTETLLANRTYIITGDI